jgi:NDP-sugar pyrophosphorylase family protein
MDEFLSLAANHTIIAVPHEGDKWIDVGTTESVTKAEAMFL